VKNIHLRQLHTVTQNLKNMKTITLTIVFHLILIMSIKAQSFERYKTLTDTTIISKNLGFEKSIKVTVPVEWQSDINKNFPLIIIFDKQNQRSHNYILQTIDYLTSNEQMPSCVIVSVESVQEYRYLETLYNASDANGLAEENEKFIFEELIPLAEKQYKASDYRLFVGHSRYGFFTTSLLTSRTEELNAIISLSPFFQQKNVCLTDSLNLLSAKNLQHPVYYRFGIGNDYPEDFYKMDSVLQSHPIPMLNAKGYLFKEAEHNVTPGLTIAMALYQIFEKWSEIQSEYLINEHFDLTKINELEKEIERCYGNSLAFSLGILNGKGWDFYSNEQYDEAVEAWEILLKNYPNFSEGYLYIIDAQMKLGKDTSDTKKLFLTSVAKSKFYSEDEIMELMEDYKSFN